MKITTWKFVGCSSKFLFRKVITKNLFCHKVMITWSNIFAYCKLHFLLDSARIRGSLKRQILNSEMLSAQCWRVAPLWSGWASNHLLPAVSYTGKWRRLTTRLAGLPASRGGSPKESRRPSKCTVAHPTPVQPTPALHGNTPHPNLEFSHITKKNFCFHFVLLFVIAYKFYNIFLPCI